MKMSDHPRLVSIHDALKLVAANRPLLNTEQVTLENCLGRTLFADASRGGTVTFASTSSNSVR
ncbi:MAG: hypothetical protein AAFQ15_11465, partial [Pseudomonadota bacterium]